AHPDVGGDGRDLARRHPHGCRDRVAVLALCEQAEHRVALLWSHLLGHQLLWPSWSSSASFSRNQPLINPVRSSLTPASSSPWNCSQRSGSRRSVTDTRSVNRVPLRRPTARSGSVTHAFRAARL